MNIYLLHYSEHRNINNKINMTVLNYLSSIIITLLFDYIRDLRCKSLGDCCHSITLQTFPSYILDENWKVVLLSYNYAVFYGYMCSYVMPEFIISNNLMYFICIIKQKVIKSIHTIIGCL